MKLQTESIEERIELLVDGELPECDRVAVFGALEQSPDGWRTCALAYAEAQVLGESLSGREREVGNAPASTSPRWWRFGGVAAALVAAFFAGRVTEAPASGGGAGVVQESLRGAAPVRARPAVFRNSVAEGGAPAYRTHERLPEFMLQALVAAGHRVRLAERKLHLDAPGGDGIELPLVETEIIDMRPLAL